MFSAEWVALNGIQCSWLNVRVYVSEEHVLSVYEQLYTVMRTCAYVRMMPLGGRRESRGVRTETLVTNEQKDKCRERNRKRETEGELYNDICLFPKFFHFNLFSLVTDILAR